MHMPSHLHHRFAHYDRQHGHCHSTILTRSPDHHAPATCGTLSGGGGGLYAYGYVTFETMSHINIHACTAGGNMHMPRHLRHRYRSSGLPTATLP